jgi:ABC-type amino acid transport substrate-binding protein
LIIATGEYGDSDAASVTKRVVVGAMWLLGVVLVALFTASVTSSQTVARLRSDIRGPEDLPGKTIGTASGSVAAEYLSKLGLPFVPVTSADEGFRLLSQGSVQAIVFDAPTLQYWVARRGDSRFLVVGPIFRPEKYGIVVAEGSPLRKKINAALLRIFDDGTYEQLYKKWFAHAR